MASSYLLASTTLIVALLLMHSYGEAQSDPDTGTSMAPNRSKLCRSKCCRTKLCGRRMCKCLDRWCFYTEEVLCATMILASLGTTFWLDYSGKMHIGIWDLIRDFLELETMTTSAGHLHGRLITRLPHVDVKEEGGSWWGIIIGVVGVFLVLAAVGYFFLRRKNRGAGSVDLEQPEAPQSSDGQMSSGPVGSTLLVSGDGAIPPGSTAGMETPSNVTSAASMNSNAIGPPEAASSKVGQPSGIGSPAGSSKASSQANNNKSHVGSTTGGGDSKVNKKSDKKASSQASRGPV